ncbi:RibD family protein [Vulcanococcus limneticus]|uniref:RibD family protein n=1 Tax=Vulcanococcus limneticus TaxID=2170428 RepID=UPI00398C0893
MPQIRLVLAVSLDGRLAPPGGGPAQLGGAGDRRVLEEALAWADGCLIGARTLRLHGNTCLIRRPELLEQRRRAGRSPQPIAIVVSRSGQLDPALPFFGQPLRRGLLWPLPPEAAPAEPAGFDQSWPLNSWPEALAALGASGLGRLVLLGGAELAGALLALDLVEQLQLTLCPLLLGGPHSWLPEGVALPVGDWELLEQRPLGEGELLLRYGRRRH